MLKEICFEDILFNATKEVFETMIFMDVEPCPDCITIQGDSLLGSITFTGDIEGCMAICCDSKCAASVARNMLAMDDGDEISSEDIRDAMGEIANMVMGSIKARLMKETLSNLDMSVPSVITGTSLTTSLGEKAREIVKAAYIEENFVQLTFQYRTNQ